MILPPGLIAEEHAATIFTAEAKMIKSGTVVSYKGNEDDLSSKMGSRTLPKAWINQLYFPVDTMEDGVYVTYGRASWRAVVKIIKIDDKRRWCTIEYMSGKQKTVKLNSCTMKNAYLVPIHFSCYESIRAETAVFYGDRPKDFKPNYLVSDNYEAREHAGAIYAFRKGSPVIDLESKFDLQLPKIDTTLAEFTNEMPTRRERRPITGGIVDQKSIISTHWADKLTIRMLEAKRDIIDVMIEQRETKIFESENPE